MREKNHLYKKVLDTAPFGTLFFAYGVCIDANHKALNLLRCERNQLVGLSLNELSDDQPESLTQLKAVIEKLESEQLQGLLWRSQKTLESDEIVVSVDEVEGTDNALSIMLYPLPALAQMVVQEYSPEPATIIQVAAEKSVAEERSSEPELLIDTSPARSSQASDTEVIAGLPIGHTLLTNINRYLDGGAANCGALLLIDLDHFNSINESLGKHIGAQILDRASQTIQNMLGPNMQMNQVAGDAFLLFIEDLATSQTDAEQRATAIANEIRCTISRPFFTENGEVIVTASVGISVLVTNSDSQSMTASEAIQQAESAMFEAKRRGRDAVMLFDSQITRRAQQRISLQSSLRKAVVNQEFDLYLQPQVSTHDSSVVGGEVLLRWIHSGQAMHTPADFIPILEASGMIVDVGLWVIRTSCEYLRNMLDRGIWTPDMQLGVNISPKQFHDPGLITSLEHSLKSYDISPDMLTLEVTENLLIDDFESVVEKMKKIRDMGTRFAIDDFGSGYSSMIYLKRLPLDILKIDREFIANLNADKDTLGLVEAIMMVSRHYGLDVVAEGVEKREVLEVLRSLGCDKYQGAHFSMPVSLDKFQRLLVA
jgi:diguanylate cyclase (GGDEF)-like protein